MTFLTARALKQIKYIHQLSRKLNGKTKSRHEKKLLSLMHDHTLEIKKLYKQKNSHCLVEVGDLLILCLELLLENKCSINEIFEGCIKRYDKKITELLEKFNKVKK